MAKKIVITDCIQCPLFNECKAIKALTAKQRFILKTAVGLQNAILQNCPLPDNE